jgi:arylsulfatase A
MATLSCTIIILIPTIFLNSCQKAGLKPDNPIYTGQYDSPSVAKPNIILILADDLGYEVPTCDGGQSYSTPNLDRMAAGGIRFTNCNSTPLCSPSRVEILTGKYNFRNYGKWGVLPTTNRTFANMLKNAGYKTLVSGKWQCDGGDTSIHTFGFDDYAVYDPFDTTIGEGSRYKDPSVYTKGKLIPKKYLTTQYGDDLFTQKVLDFIDSNENKPFCIYFPICLVHYPFCPTPDDPEFAGWDPSGRNADIRFFPSMVKYLDKKVGEVMNRVDSLGIDSKTIVIFVGDNGTDGRITSEFENTSVKGGKSKTYYTGTHVPMIIWGPGAITPGVVNDQLVDFTDFLPTFADIAHVNLPTTYGPLDGVSFYPSLVGRPTNLRQWMFCHYDQNEQGERKPIRRWVWNTTYKLYDTSYLFYNIHNDAYEQAFLPPTDLSPEESAIKANFATVLSRMHN